MPTPFAPRIILPQNARSDLQTLTRAHCTPQSLALRTRIVLRAADSDSIRPHDGYGSGIPRPRNDKAASTRMAEPSWAVPSTISGASVLGSTWRSAIETSFIPTARAADFPAGVYTSPRASKAKAAPFSMFSTNR